MGMGALFCQVLDTLHHTTQYSKGYVRSDSKSESLRLMPLEEEKEDLGVVTFGFDSETKNRTISYLPSRCISKGSNCTIPSSLGVALPREQFSFTQSLPEFVSFL